MFAKRIRVSERGYYVCSGFCDTSLRGVLKTTRPHCPTRDPADRRLLNASFSSTEPHIICNSCEVNAAYRRFKEAVYESAVPESESPATKRRRAAGRVEPTRIERPAEKEEEEEKGRAMRTITGYARKPRDRIQISLTRDRIICFSRIPVLTVIARPEMRHSLHHGVIYVQ